MGARSAGAQAFLLVAPLLLAALVFIAACTSAEAGVADLPPTPVPSPTVETASPAPSATGVPMSTPTPTVESSATPVPTPTPTGSELHGPLLVEGAYDWPLEMPGDLTEDEIFAVNIFISAQNADFAAIEGRSSDLSEFEPVLDYVQEGITQTARNTISRDRAEGRTQIFDSERTNLVAIKLQTAGNDVLLETCEHHVTTHALDTGLTVDGEVATLEREVLVERIDGTLLYEGWRVINVTLGDLIRCDS